MQKNLLEYLEATRLRHPNKIAFRDESKAITFESMYQKAKAIGTSLCKQEDPNQPIIVLIEKQITDILLCMGTLYSGCYYIPVGVDVPESRLRSILDLVDARLVLASDSMEAVARQLCPDRTVCTYSQLTSIPAPDDTALAERRRLQIDEDPAVVIFTSGSSGIPKGVLLPHRAIIDYIDVFTQTFDFSDREILGNQSPLDYVAALRDVYIPLRTGAETVLLDKRLFSSPLKLLEEINKHKITCLCWVAPALSLCADLNVFSSETLKTVDKVFFTGSSMPCKQLRYWQDHLPNALYVNHYGPTEITASCTYYVVDRKVDPTETLSIGVPFSNTGIVLLDENNLPVSEIGEYGEICVRGTCLALGYYKDPKKTAEIFVQNPANSIYRDLIYRTGDIGSYSSDRTLSFHGRKDSQIKHMGHRVELAEIETAAGAIDGVETVCCLYDDKTSKICLFYTGSALERRDILLRLRETLPKFMLPARIVQIDAFPYLPNGKISRQEVQRRYIDLDTM